MLMEGILEANCNPFTTGHGAVFEPTQAEGVAASKQKRWIEKRPIPQKPKRKSFVVPLTPALPDADSRVSAARL